MGKPKIIEIARRFLGLTEDKGPNRDSRGLIKEFNRVAGWKGKDGIPYCATFVSYCAIRAGLPIGGVIGILDKANGGKRDIVLRPGTASVYAMHRYFKEDPHNCGVKWSVVPKVGDVIFMDTRQDGIYNHVGLIEHIIDGESKVFTIEGNTTDSGLDELKEEELTKKNLEESRQLDNDPTGGGVHRKVRNAASSMVVGFGRFPELEKPTIHEESRRGLFPSETAEMLAGLKKEQAKGIQIFLNAIGAYKPSDNNSIDGIIGKSTIRAITRVLMKWNMKRRH